MADAATAPEKKDLLLSQGAHEIRNPISVILGYVRMLASERLGPLTDAQRKAVEEIEPTGVVGIVTRCRRWPGCSRGGNCRPRAELAALIAVEIPRDARQSPCRHPRHDDAPAAR